jgi:hypothetical protein
MSKHPPRCQALVRNGQFKGLQCTKTATWLADEGTIYCHNHVHGPATRLSEK